MLQTVQPTKESIKVLEECAAIQKKKGSDYQNPNSNVRQAMHYRRGIDSIHDLLQGKLYRAQSLLEAANTPGGEANFESIEDTYMDLINYASFAVEYLRGKMDGQDPDRDIFNKKKVVWQESPETRICPPPGDLYCNSVAQPSYAGVDHATK